jgi:hypothetical protein
MNAADANLTGRMSASLGKCKMTAKARCVVPDYAQSATRGAITNPKRINKMSRRLFLLTASFARG